MKALFITADQMPFVFTCPTCKEEHTLEFNGGGLDAVTCCGKRYELNIELISLSIIDGGKPCKNGDRT